MSANDIIANILVFLVIIGIPLFVTALFLLWLNPTTILEKLASAGIGAIVFFVVLCIDLIAIALFKD